ncbi:MAG: hypothetical protein HYY17_01625 [Planctomycetes bacterium]|nr:hypothetical protein [Planctomycetota bacterium]
MSKHAEDGGIKQKEGRRAFLYVRVSSMSRPPAAFLLLLLAACVAPRRPDVPLSSRIDAVLGPRQNAGPDGIVLGSCGARLRAEGLLARPGMQGKFSVDGAARGPLFALEIIENGRPIVFPPLAHLWWPSHVGMEGRAEGLRLLERKFITADDRAVDLVHIQNESCESRTLLLRAAGLLERTVTLAPGALVEFPIVFGGAPAAGSVDEMLERHLAEYSGWFEKNIPDFECADAWFMKLWYHRWFLARAGRVAAVSDLRWQRGPGGGRTSRRSPAEEWALHLVHPDRERMKSLISGMEPELAGCFPEGFDESIAIACGVHADATACILAPSGDALAHRRCVVIQAQAADVIEKLLARPDAAKSLESLFPHAYRVLPPEERRYDAVFDRLFDPAQFWTPIPAPWKSGGTEVVLSFDSLVLEALANAIKFYRIPSVTRARFFDFLHRYVRAQFDGGDFSKPGVPAAVHAETGAWLTPADRDVRSGFADILIRHMGGLTPRADDVLEFHPIVEALPWFRFRNVPYRGALLEIRWDAREGFSVKRDGKLLFTTPALRHVEWGGKTGLRILD